MMEVKDWVFLILGLVNLIVIGLLAPAVKSLVTAISTLTTRVTVLEDRNKDDRETDSKTATEIHAMHGELVKIQLTMAKLEGSQNTMGQLLSDRIGNVAQVVAQNLGKGGSLGGGM